MQTPAMIDPLLSLALSMYSNPGVYALLLGSGVSRVAEIPTGWEVTLDLVRKLACMKNEDCEPSPDVWYKEAYGEAPDYSKLLDALAKFPAERSQLLRPYFEPNEEERERGLKSPTLAHRMIADLVANGYLRAIVTTNFDRLIETAIEGVGIVPHVVSTADDVEGMFPLVHTRCSVVKVNGDYLDTRIKNTRAELAEYDPRLDDLLDRIFDEFGLVVCGWSGEWDIALCNALRRCKNHRFATYWTVRGTLTDSAKTLIARRGAEVIDISDADSFFQQLHEKVLSLRDIAGVHPLSPKVASASVKRYVVEDRHMIRLHDLAVEETEKLYADVFGEDFPVSAPYPGDDAFLQRVQRFESPTEVLLNIIMTGCYWGTASHHFIWTKCLETLANPPPKSGGSVPLLNLRIYPALILLYAGGIASIAAEKHDTFAALLTQPMVRRATLVNDVPLLLEASPYKVIEKDRANNILFPQQAKLLPVSEHFYQLLREPFRQLLPSDRSYQLCFDRFEYLRSLVQIHEHDKHLHGHRVVYGCYICRREVMNQIMKEVASELDAQGENWPLLRLGLFEGSIDTLKDIKAQWDEHASQVGRQWW